MIDDGKYALADFDVDDLTGWSGKGMRRDGDKKNRENKKGSINIHNIDYLSPEIRHKDEHEKNLNQELNNNSRY